MKRDFKKRWVQLISGEKGGTGKSVTATQLYECYKVHDGLKLQAIDGDLTNPSLSIMYRNVIPLVLSDDRDELDQLNVLFTAALEKDTDVIVDLPARSESILTQWMNDYKVLSLAEKYNIQFVKWWVSDGDPLSIPIFIESTKKFPKIEHIFVKNMGLAKPRQWSQWELDRDMAEWREEGEIVELPFMDKNLIAYSRKVGKSFRALMQDSNVNVLDQGRYEGFLDQGIQAFSNTRVFKEILEAQQAASDGDSKSLDKEVVDSSSAA